jgi:hypothetical protein
MKNMTTLAKGSQENMMKERQGKKKKLVSKSMKMLPPTKEQN